MRMNGCWAVSDAFFSFSLVSFGRLIRGSGSAVSGSATSEFFRPGVSGGFIVLRSKGTSTDDVCVAMWRNSRALLERAAARADWRRAVARSGRLTVGMATRRRRVSRLAGDVDVLLPSICSDWSGILVSFFVVACASIPQPWSRAGGRLCLDWFNLSIDASRVPTRLPQKGWLSLSLCFLVLFTYFSTFFQTDSSLGWPWWVNQKPIYLRRWK